MKGIYEAIEEFKVAERMFNYATERRDIDNAINLMDLANRKIKAYKNIDATYFDIKPLNETPPTLLEMIKGKFKEGVK
jgi:hypothetical protein